MSKTTKQKARRLLPFPVIAAAVGGDADAMNAILRHYSGYITTLSTRPMYDEYGNCHMRVDEGMRRRLETKLIIKTLYFKLA